jgi:hypothetical protein
MPVMHPPMPHKNFGASEEGFLSFIKKVYNSCCERMNNSERLILGKQFNVITTIIS